MPPLTRPATTSASSWCVRRWVPIFGSTWRPSAAAINKRTIALVGSAPAFPHGMVDPIVDLSALAVEHDLGLHVDACLGGFVLPWAERLGAPVDPFDFRLPGVTSMSADTHKYGYAAKGTSVVLYRSPELRRYQYYTASDWPGGLYYSPTLAGSRPGALSATCWAAMVTMGEDGYTQATASILAAADYIRTWIEQIPELTILGDPLWVIAFGSSELDIYKVLEQMSQRGWSLNGLHRPPAIHIAVTLRHTEPGVAQRFIDDLRAIGRLCQTKSKGERRHGARLRHGRRLAAARSRGRHFDALRGSVVSGVGEALRLP